MRRVTRIIGVVLLALAAFAMLAGDLFLASAAQPDPAQIAATLRGDAHSNDLNSFARLG